MQHGENALAASSPSLSLHLDLPLLSHSLSLSDAMRDLAERCSLFSAQIRICVGACPGLCEEVCKPKHYNI